MFDLIKMEDVKKPMPFAFKIVKYQAKNNYIDIREVQQICKEHRLNFNKVKMVYDSEYYNEDTFYICETEEEINTHDFVDIIRYEDAVKNEYEYEDENISLGITRVRIEGPNLIIENLWNENKNVVIYNSII